MKKDLQYYLDLPYDIKIREVPKEEGGGYLACIPLLGENRCEGYGKTRLEALEDLDGVKTHLFNDYLSRGLEILEPQKDEDQFSGKFLLRIPKILHSQLSHAAKENEVSLNSYISYLLSTNHASERLTQQFDYICGAIRKLWKWTVITPDDETAGRCGTEGFIAPFSQGEAIEVQWKTKVPRGWEIGLDQDKLQ